MRALWPSLCAAMLVCACFFASDARAIIRRHDVADSQYVVGAEEFPQVVDLLEPGDCLATLIAPQWLITAAHCTEGVGLPHSVPIAGRARAVASFVVHPGYDGWDHDITLVRLEEPVTDVSPLPLYRATGEVGQTVILVGRGDTGTGLLGQSDATLDLLTRRATNTVATADELWLTWTFRSPETTGVTELEGISGDGDSGGPSFIEVDGVLHVAGISSWQDADDPELGKYGVVENYSRVSTELDFIDAALGGETIPPPATHGRDGGCSVTDQPGPGWQAFVFVLCFFWLGSSSRLRTGRRSIAGSLRRIGGRQPGS